MKKLFLFLVIAVFAFASCGKKSSKCTEKAHEAKEHCEEPIVIDEEIIEFEDGEVIEVDEVE